MDNWVKHKFEEGSRDHVLWWDTRGEHCKVKNCEVNKKHTGK